MSTPTQLRNAGQAQAEHASDPRVILDIDAKIREFNYQGWQWSANDVRECFPVTSRGLVGARVDAARKRGEMEAVGWVKSTLPSTRGKPVVVWRGKAVR